MAQAQLHHFQFCVAPANFPFYERFMAHLGWRVESDEEGVYVIADNGQNIWFSPTDRAQTIDRDAQGLNHLALKVDSMAEVDEASGVVRGLGIEPLFGTPCERPEYSDEAETYYSLMFATPDGFDFEVVYSGPR